MYSSDEQYSTVPIGSSIIRIKYIYMNDINK